MKHLPARIADAIIAGEPLWLVMALPLLVFPRGYVWQWQRGLFHYAPIEDPALRYPGLLSWLGLGIVALPWLLRWLRRGRPTRPTALDLPIALYLVTAALSLWPSVDRAHSLNFLLLLVAGIAIYYGVVNAVGTEAQLYRAVALFLAGGVALGVVGLIQTDWSQAPRTWQLPALYEWLQRLPNPLGRTLNQGITAGAAVLFIPVGGSLALTARRWPVRSLAAGATLFLAGFLLLSQSRGDILALALTVPAMWLWRRRQGYLWPMSAFLGLPVLLAGLVLYAPHLVARIAYTYPGRWQVWERAAAILRDHPLTGIGLDTFRIVAQNVYPYFDYALDQTVNAHNRLLQVGVDQGLVGLGAFVALVILFYRANHRAWQQAGTRTNRGLALGLGGGFTALMFGNVLDDGVLTGRAGLAVWYLLGLGMAQAYLVGRETDPARAPSIRRWLGRREARTAVGAGALLLVALVALALSPLIWHNLGNVARNQGWLAVDASAGVREANAFRTLTFYDRAGDRALRDRGALILLAHDGRRIASSPDFFAAIAARTSIAEAVADLEAAVTRYPGDRFAHLYLAEAYRAAGRLLEAAAEYERAGAPVDWVIAEGRRRWDWGQGDYEGAVVQLTIATLMAPDSFEAYKALGQCHARADQFPAAVAAYSRALELKPDDTWVRQELARLQGKAP